MGAAALITLSFLDAPPRHMRSRYMVYTVYLLAAMQKCKRGKMGARRPMADFASASNVVVRGIVYIRLIFWHNVIVNKISFSD